MTAPAARALCIGINAYPGTGRDLLGCLNDAHDWAEVLEQRGYDVTVLVDGDATGDNICDAVAELVTAAGSAPRVLTYAGHGSYQPDVSGDEPDAIDEVLCPTDVASGRIVSDDDLVDLFSRKRQGVPLTFISDSCHAGGLGLRQLPTGASNGTATTRFLPPEVFSAAARSRDLRVSRRRPDRRRPALLFAACQPSELAADATFRGRPGGAFTRAALRALRAPTSTPTYQQWFERTLDYLPNRSHPQRPLLEGTKPQRSRLALH
jgi:hypothetical protein